MGPKLVGAKKERKRHTKKIKLEDTKWQEIQNREDPGFGFKNNIHNDFCTTLLKRKSDPYYSAYFPKQLPDTFVL